ncbi:SpoIIE family protein phosphatase [Peterkaempfera sp. SMS 1(5)a]|uniref:SpoIIE family protein phosphatase n=1 Tax=Peterkaempfera podocarpi TaxID=3232308 RepID=UPI00366F8EBA
MSSADNGWGERSGGRPYRRGGASARALLRRARAARGGPAATRRLPAPAEAAGVRRESPPGPGVRSRTPARFPGAVTPSGTDGAQTAGGLLDVVQIAVALLDTAGRVVLWSPAAERLLGWPSDHLVGRRLEEVMVAPDRAHRARQAYDHAIRTGSWRGRTTASDRDGNEITVDLRISLLVDGDGVPFLQLAFSEAAALEAVERDLATRDALFEQAALGIAVLDTQLRYVGVNAMLAGMNGVPPEEHIGRTTGEVLPERAADEVSAIQREVLATGEPIVDVTVASPSARRPGYRSISYSRLTDRSGKVLGIAGMVMDVTDRYRAVAKVEHARRRLALLNEFGSRVGDLLDASRIAQELAAAVVPRLADYSGVILLQAVASGDDLPRHQHSRNTALVQLGVASVEEGPQVRAMLRRGSPVEFTDDSVFGEALRTGVPRMLCSPAELENSTYPGDPRVQVALDLGIHCMLVVPLRARGIVIGLLVVSRAGRREAFDRDDLAFAVELADRAGSSLDNARLYARERAAAVTLQRTLLPQQVPQPPGVEVAYRYVPGSSGAEVGGDWFDVIPLPGARTALVVGDVMGHGLRAAATMGRLRTAVRTLAGLDLPPAVLLDHVHQLADDLVQGPDEALIATCVYAVYDPATRRCVLAKAGHIPPLLVVPAEGAVVTVPGAGPLPGGSTRVLDLPSGAPLGVGGVPFESVELEIPEGSLLALCTDGLVESRDRDLDEGLARLQDVLEKPHASIQEACEAVLGIVDQGREPDDVALLLARLGRSPSQLTAGWTLPGEPSAAARARRLTRATLKDWELEELADTAELLTSELVTNAVRYATAPIGLRLMVCERTLLLEVSDPLPQPPVERRAAGTDEGGRGLELVRRLALRWGTRSEGPGKVVWLELPLPVRRV